LLPEAVDSVTVSHKHARQQKKNRPPCRCLWEKCAGCKGSMRSNVCFGMTGTGADIPHEVPGLAVQKGLSVLCMPAGCVGSYLSPYHFAHPPTHTSQTMKNIASGRDFIDALSIEVAELEAQIARAAEKSNLDTARQEVSSSSSSSSSSRCKYGWCHWGRKISDIDGTTRGIPPLHLSVGWRFCSSRRSQSTSRPP